MNRKTAKLFLIPAILFAVFLVFGNEAKAAGTTYYVSPTGSANCASGCLTGAPCSLATVLTCNVVGDDNVILKNGTYTGTSLTVPWSGTSGHPITIKAENPWKAIVDGQCAFVPLLISNKNYIDIEDIIFKNSSEDVVKITGLIGTASHINLRRLAAINAGTGSGANFHLFLLYGTGVSYVLIEDSYASQGSYSGSGRHGIAIYGGPHHNTIRRNYILYYKNQSVTNPGCSGITVYGAGDYNIIENNVMNFSIGDISNCGLTYKAIANVSQSGNPDGPEYTKFYGNVAIASSVSPKFSDFAVIGVDSDTTYRITGVELIDNVFLNAESNGVLGYSVGNILYKNNTLVNVDSASTGVLAAYTCCQDVPSIGIAKNNSLLTSGGKGLNSYGTGSMMASTYNNFYGILTAYSGAITDKAGDKTLNPSYDKITYGNGAYLMVPSALVGQGEGGADIGAEVLYRYQDGVFTNQPLWPWPMEDRIKAETGISVTYEADGGIWKTLDGVYSQQPDTIPPAAPAGLMVQ